jgi:uncharacterized protein
LKNIHQRIAQDLNITEKQVVAAVNLIDEGNTIPFIARYRKEVTGNLDDDALRQLGDRLDYLRKLEKRQEEIIAAIEEQGKLTEELKAAILAAEILQELEDLYLPYKQKRKTRASVARQRGLEPLAQAIDDQQLKDEELLVLASDFLGDEVATPEDALAGAQDIVAEDVSDNAAHRKNLRRLIGEQGKIVSTVTKDFAEEKNEFHQYYDYQEAIKSIVNHRILAINRGESRGVLSVKIEETVGESYLLQSELKGKHHGYMEEALVDAYKRLIFPSIERELRTALKERAESAAIQTFAMNLKELLMQPPFKDKVTLGLDPGYRTGCKVAVLGAMGELLDTATIYPTPPKKEIAKSERVLLDFIRRYGVALIAIGNGTASRESEMFVADLLKKTDHPVEYMVVNEAGASIYSASALGAEEYPELDVSLRGAVSIAGRLQDPLSELVKIDPKHIGVGQYQHDVNQRELSKALDDTVEDAVNKVGVYVNRASKPLLQYVSGISKSVADHIIAHREEKGKFTNRRELKKVKGLGPKTFEQCAGFLRIDDGDEILDNTGVHPESYRVAKTLMSELGLTAADLKDRRQKEKAKTPMSIEAMAEKLGVGEPTLRDIILELKKPGRDPRDSAPKPYLKSEAMDIKDLKVGMEMTGTVRNVVDFGAFVDIGVHQDGLVHLSQICERYITHPSEALSVGDVISVKVISLDLDRMRIGLTMRY